MPEDPEDDPVDRDRDPAPRPDPSLPHPLDRVWVHPSELPARGPLPVAAARPAARRSTWRRAPTLFALLAGAASGGMLALGGLALIDAIGHDTDPPEVSGTRETERPAPPAIVTIAREVAGSIVQVRSVGPEGGRSGSGVAIRHRGEILTSDALVAAAETVVAVDDEGGEHAAEVLGRDPDSGLALLRIDSPLDTAALDEAVPAPGTRVHAVGARPGQAVPWVSEGIVSATGVRVGTADGIATTDILAADVQPGAASAGGALVDASGEVVAIVLAPVPGDPTTYAVPIARAVEIAEHLRMHGTVPHGWLGITGRDGAYGVEVTDVVAGGPADRAGLRPGDVVRGVDGERVTRMVDLLAEVRSTPPGDAIALDVLRRRRELPMMVEVGDTQEGADVVALGPVPR